VHASSFKFINHALIFIDNYSHFLELQDALTLSEQTKTNLESELRVFESNMQNLNQQVIKAEREIIQLSSQKEKLVGFDKSIISFVINILN